MTDARFADVGLTRADVTALRERFAGWPRDAEATDRQLRAGNAAEPQPGPAAARAVAGVSRVKITLTRPGHNTGPDRTATLKPTGTTRRPSHDLTGPQDFLLSTITCGSTYCYRTARSPELAAGELGRALQNLVNLANNAGAVDGQAGRGEVGRGADVDLGAVRSGDDPDAGLLEPIPSDQYRVCDGRELVVEA